MEKTVKALLLDIGGVMLSKGWGREARKVAAERFGYDLEESEDRHALTFVTYEEGDITLDQYLDQVVFYEDRSFTRDDYKAFMYAQSGPMPDMLAFFADLKARTGLRMVAVSNEGRDLALHRVREFHLDGFLDFFVFSCFVHRRKPDPLIYRMALDQTLLPPEEVVYIDDNALLVEVARSLGLPAFRHENREKTAQALARYGIPPPSSSPEPRLAGG